MNNPMLSLALAQALISGSRDPMPEPVFIPIAQDLAPSKQAVQSGGKRSRKRRAAKLRAAGWAHTDKDGWISPEERAPLPAHEYT